MSDGSARTPGSGETIATDEVVDGTLGTVKVQFMKLMDGTLDGTNKATVSTNGLAIEAGGAVANAAALGTQKPILVAGSDGTSAYRLSTDTTGAVRIAPRTASIAVTSSGLTTVTTVYTTGDVLGTELTITGAARATGGSGTIMAVVATDDSAVLGAFDIFLFTAASTPAADNAANSWSDASMQTCIGVINMPASTVSALNSVATLPNIGLPFVTSGSANLFAVMVARSANAVFAGGATSVRLQFKIYQD